MADKPNTQNLYNSFIRKTMDNVTLPCSLQQTIKEKKTEP